ncbi:NAD(P)-dependent oxidoreductase [soil metagenome]
MKFKKILITGAAGRVGRTLRRSFGDNLGPLRLTDIVPVSQLAAHEEYFPADLTDPGQIAALCDGVDAVIHLAGTPNAKDWYTANRLNIEVTQRLFDAAYKAGIKRIVYASSIHVFGMYELGINLHPDLPPRPDGYYGISKVFGEAALRYHADKHGITGISVRIGSFRSVPGNVRELATWLSPNDCASLFERALVAPVTGYFDPLGFSKNTRLPIIDSNWQRLGYLPADDGERFANTVALPTEDERRIWYLLGAHMTGPEY